MTAYPPSLSLVRSLTLELRDDDPQSGWSLLRDVSGQVESLELHICDRYASAPGVEAYLADDGEDEESLERWKERWDSVPDLLANWEAVLGRNTRFSHLSHLTFASTARGLANYFGFAHHLPDLVSLVWSCHWSEETSYNIDHDIMGVQDERPPRVSSLKTLSVSAAPVILRWALRRLLTTSPNVSALTLFRKEDINHPLIFSGEINGIHKLLADHKRISHLALYGGLPELLLVKLNAVRSVDPSAVSLSHITTLVLEQSSMSRSAEQHIRPLMNPVVRSSLN